MLYDFDHPLIEYDVDFNTGKLPCGRDERIGYWNDCASSNPGKIPASLLMAWFNNDFAGAQFGEAHQAREVIGRFCDGGTNLSDYLLACGEENIGTAGGIWRGFSSWFGEITVDDAIKSCLNGWSSWSTDRAVAEGLANNSGILLHAFEGPFYAICRLADHLPPNCGQVESEHLLPPCDLVAASPHSETGFTIVEVAAVRV